MTAPDMRPVKTVNAAANPKSVIAPPPITAPAIWATDWPMFWSPTAFMSRSGGTSCGTIA